MMRWFSLTAMTLGAGLVISACGGDSREPAMTPAAQVAQAHNARDAAEMIASARCDREQRCNNIGANLEYQSREHCMNVFRADSNEELAEDADCQNGIKPEDLNECMSQLSSRSCGPVGAAFDSLASTVSCRSAELCMD